MSALTAAHLTAVQTASEGEALAMVGRLSAAATAAGLDPFAVTAALAEAILPTPAPVQEFASTSTDEALREAVATLRSILDRL